MALLMETEEVLRDMVKDFADRLDQEEDK